MLEILSWVGVAGLVEEFCEFKVVSEERSRIDELLTSHNNDSLTSEDLVGDLGSESSDEVASSIDDNLLFEHT